jgi:ribonuclease HI
VSTSRRPGKVYVVTAPASIRGIYETWEACRAAVAGVAGARFQGVAGRAVAEALLSGEGVRLEPGLYAFVDGNAMGGIGVVLVTEGGAGGRVVHEIATTVYEACRAMDLPGLRDRASITAATDRLRNILAELGALFIALREVPAGSALTVVHDYEGVAAWMEDRWKTRDALVTAIVERCRAVIAERGLRVGFRHQRGHESTFAGPNDFATFNGRADALATGAGMGPA